MVETSWNVIITEKIIIKMYKYIISTEKILYKVEK